MGFTAIGRFLVHRRKLVLGLTVLLVLAAGAYGADVAGRLSAGGFSDPAAESTRAEAYLSKTMGAGLPNLVLLVQTKPDTATTGEAPGVDRPEVAASGEAVTARLAAEPGVTQVASYWSLGRPPPLRADNGESALVVAHAAGDENEVNATTKRVMAQFNGSNAVTVVRTGGISAGYAEASEIIEKDLRSAELIALPITLLVLLLVFRSLVAALMPIIGGIIAIVGTFALLKALSGVTEVSVFALNLTTAMGLGLAIDYSLFVLSRYREERGRGRDPHEAVVRTVATAGRSVVLSGLTVAVSMSALLLFPMAFLRSFAYAGIPVVFLAVLSAAFALPALLAVLGDRIDAVPVGRRNRTPKPVTESFWYRLPKAVMRRPVGVATGATAFLLLLAVPFFHLTPGLPDDRVLPPEAQARAMGDELRAHYSSRETGSLAVVLPGATVDDTALDAYAARLSGLPDVSRVDARTGVYLKGQRVVPPGVLTARFVVTGGDWLSVVPAIEPLSPESETLVQTVRASTAPSGDVLVTGPGAAMLDSKAAVMQRLPWALAVVGGATFILLFLSFGSLLVPIKALILNTLSLTATFGLMVWVFQDGHLAESLHFSPTGMLDLSTPILMFCVAFGMSMDYEVFLLSRIKEEHDKGVGNEESVALGISRSARIITAAAATFSVVLLAFATSNITFIKLFGLGLATAVIVDATVIRGLLVPAFMRLAGEANWWAPRWMRAVQRRIDLSEHEPDDGPGEALPDTPAGAEPVTVGS